MTKREQQAREYVGEMRSMWPEELDWVSDRIQWFSTRQRRERWQNLTWALMQGGYAADIESTKPNRDNPYFEPDYRWAWYTGFDLGQRLNALIFYRAEDLQRFKECNAAKDETIARKDREIEELKARLA
jgi:hypothetical protein